MAVTRSGNFDDMPRRARRGIELGLRDLTLLTKAEIQKQNPVDTGLSRIKWATRFSPGNLRGIVGNNTRYIKEVAEGPRRKRRLSRKQRRNLNFHQRGANKAIKRAQLLMERQLRRAGFEV